MNCVNCGAVVEMPGAVFSCPYCGGLNQTVPVVLAQALRIETLNNMATVLIPKWRALPTGHIEIFSTGIDNQQAISVHILQGDHDKVQENRIVGLFVFDGIPSARRGVPKIQFTFEIMEDGILIVTAEDQRTGKRTTFPRMYLEVRKKAG